MPFITNKERETLIKSSNKDYTFRKILYISTIGLLLVIISIISCISVLWVLQSNDLHSKGLTNNQVWIQMCSKWWSPFSVLKKQEALEGEAVVFGFSGFAWFLLSLIILVLGASVTSIVFIVISKSPKNVQDNIGILEGAAVSGETAKKMSPIEIIKQRRESTKKE